MKQLTKTFLTSACTLALLGSFSSAFADINSDAERLLNWAEITYPTIFTTRKTTLRQGPWIYRNYSEVGILAGVNTSDNKVYVMGGPWGNTPTVVGPLTTLMARVDGTTSPPPSSSQICDAASVPAGMSVTQNGNVITVTTNGNCIVPPTDQNYCEFDLPEQPQVTNIHVLTTGVTSSVSLTGITSTFPGLLDQFQQSGLNFKTCVINAPTESTANLTINTNVCYDISAQIGAIPSNPFLTITPPVRQTVVATATTTRVSDCFATTADSVTDLVTKDVWTKQNGVWTKLPKTP
jgi:hypothetical protein